MSEMWRPSQKYSRALITDEDLRFANQMHKFVDEEVMPRRRDLEGGPDRHEHLAKKTIADLTQKLVDMGIQRAFFPEEIGGMGLTSRVTGCILSEELSRGDIGLANWVFVNPWAFTPAFMSNNTVVLEEFGRPFCGDKPLSACMALTEPAGGCNIEDSIQQGRTIQTIATLDGNEWVINGQKLWPSNAGEAEVYFTLCTTDPKLGDEGVTFIAVPKDAPGLTFGEPEHKMGLTYTDVSAAFFYEDVRVPKEFCCGAPGGEGAEILHTLVNGRLEDGPLSIGGAQAALETAVEYTGERFIRGKPVRDQSMHAGILGEMAAQVQNARASYLYAASMFDRPEQHGAPNSIQQIARASAVKMFTTQTAIDVMLKAIELMGAAGYSSEFHVERYLRDVVMVRLWVGGPQLSSLDSARAHYPFNPW